MSGGELTAVFGLIEQGSGEIRSLMSALLRRNLLLHLQVSRMKHKKHIHNFYNLFCSIYKIKPNQSHCVKYWVIYYVPQCWNELNIGTYKLFLHDLILET